MATANKKKEQGSEDITAGIPEDVVPETVVSTEIGDNTKTDDEDDKPKKVVKKEFDNNEFITVKNGFNGKLIYISKRTGEKFIWENFGDEQEIELLELKNAKNSRKGFFIKNWFMFDDPEILDHLGVSQYYKFSLRLSEFDKIFDKEPDDLKTSINKLPDGQKKSLAYRARKLIGSGEIDSKKKIAVIEECLGIKLIEG